MPAHAKTRDVESHRVEPVSVPPDQREDVRALSDVLAHLATKAKRRASRLKLEGQRGERAVIPESVFSVLERAVEVLARGEAVTVVPVAHELTTQEAADMLNVSRQYLVRLVENGTIPCTKTGSHRRLRARDVIAYKRRRDRERKRALDRLSRLSQEVGGYDELRR